jgi:hypothetical protein
MIRTRQEAAELYGVTAALGDLSAAVKVGDHVKVTFTGTLDYISDDGGYAELGQDGGGIATLDPRQAAVEVLRPDIKPGQVWRDTLGRRWFVRAAELGPAGESLRFVCAEQGVDMLADGAFVSQWPDASLILDVRS